MSKQGDASNVLERVIGLVFRSRRRSERTSHLVLILVAFATRCRHLLCSLPISTKEII